MKFVKLLVSAGLLSGVMLANDSVIITEMKNMRDSMNQINDGFFYNKKDMITQGLDKLQKSNEIFKNHGDIKNYLPPKSKHMVGITFNNARKINNNINQMKNFINENKFNQASGKYTEIINSCTSCHSVVRGW